MYTFIERCKICYTWLQDDLSRNIFWKRLQFDMEPTMGHAMELLALNPFLSSSDIQEALSWKKQLEDFSKSGKKLVVYTCPGCSLSTYGPTTKTLRGGMFPNFSALIMAAAQIPCSVFFSLVISVYLGF